MTVGGGSDPANPSNKHSTAQQAERPSMVSSRGRGVDPYTGGDDGADLAAGVQLSDGVVESEVVLERQRGAGLSRRIGGARGDVCNPVRRRLMHRPDAAASVYRGACDDSIGRDVDNFTDTVGTGESAWGGHQEHGNRSWPLTGRGVDASNVAAARLQPLARGASAPTGPISAAAPRARPATRRDALTKERHVP